ncbi:MAG: DNA mismatch repair protein MutS [Firmicutes bacterium]|nr:DNA mismatch repair protein MutS [Bacillota bacterium]
MTDKLSPMMKQYMEIKAQYQDCILFFRLGDFYEMFFDDAYTGSRELELTLTGKNCGQEERAPMCGVPFHAADMYIARLVEKGYKVAICEQVEDPSTAKGIVAREVIRIITPGTLTPEMMIPEGENNYLLSIAKFKDGLGLSYCDISTGELAVTEILDSRNSYGEAIDKIARLSPKEVLVNKAFDEIYGTEDIENVSSAYVSVIGDGYFQINSAMDLISAQLGKGAIPSIGLNGRDGAIMSLGALLSYLLETQKQNLKQITKCSYFDIGRRMSLDKATIRNLEILETLYDKRKQGSLLGILDKTKTAMGARLLKSWISEPLKEVTEINRRLDSVEELLLDPLIQNNLNEALNEIYDFERLAARIASGHANGRDMLALKNSFDALPEIKNCLSYVKTPYLESINESIEDFSDVSAEIERAIDIDAGPTIKEGGLIRNGYSEELDSLKLSIKDAKDWIAGLEVREKERTGIKNLKVGFNKVFGYYIDVTKSNISLVPDNYIRKQTLVNNERYITPELEEMEGIVLNAETKINKLEYDLFCELRDKIMELVPIIQKTSYAVAELDVLNSFAIVSARNAYIKPHVDDSLVLEIISGRHPVVEQTEQSKLFVSNDTYLDDKDHSLAIITGPNMSGKSTYMRQTALIVLMAQVGCFVPAEKAHIGICDRIFTRIGASDNLAQGQSTFYVEMSELSYILNGAGERSLIILDEIGRGTSTYDGLSIAWATCEYLCNKNTHIRTLFATHYHELTALEDSLEGAFNLNVDVSEDNGEIVFLHKIVPGGASRSYGIHVAKLAGVPESILEGANKKLYMLENDSREYNIVSKEEYVPEVGEQLSLFNPNEGNEIVEKVKNIDLMNVKPSEAISILEELKDLIK